MKMFSTVAAAIDLAINHLEANKIACDTESIANIIYDWYSHSDVTDPEILAACALEGIKWRPGATYQEMLEIKDFWFPAVSTDISIWEIEQAQHDFCWR